MARSRENLSLARPDLASIASATRPSRAWPVIDPVVSTRRWATRPPPPPSHAAEKFQQLKSSVSSVSLYGGDGETRERRETHLGGRDTEAGADTVSLSGRGGRDELLEGGGMLAAPPPASRARSMDVLNEPVHGAKDQHVVVSRDF